jgi:hypothetical protein
LAVFGEVHADRCYQGNEFMMMYGALISLCQIGDRSGAERELRLREEGLIGDILCQSQPISTNPHH